MKITAAIKKNRLSLNEKQRLTVDICYPITSEVETWHKFESLMDAFKWAGERYVPLLKGWLIVKSNTVSYITASGKGEYTITPTSVSFSGDCQSFHDGCPLIKLAIRERDGKFRLDGKIYAPPTEEQFISSCLVAMFELPDAEVETLE